MYDTIKFVIKESELDNKMIVSAKRYHHSA